MKKNIEVVRFNPSSKEGLSSEQVKSRQEQKLNNKTKLVVGKSYAEIIFTNLLSFFNITLFVIAGVLIAFGKYDSLFFLIVLIPNICVGLYQDIKARVLMGKLKLMTTPRVDVVRDGKIENVVSDDVVLDDVIILKNGSQIPVDGVVLEGSVAVNESLLTGESDNIYKNVNDEVFSGSYVVSGSCYIRADKVGEDCYASSLANKANKFRRSSSEILKSLKAMFRVIGAIVIAMAVFMGVTFYNQGRTFDGNLIGKIAGSLVSMIPSGLYLLTSIALTLAVMSLGKRQAQVQDFYSVEMLARVDLLCVDKTGTITDGSMVVKEVVPVGKGKKVVIEQAVSNLLASTEDDNYTALALKKYFTVTPKKKAKIAIQFNSENKYSAAQFDDETIALGAIEALPIKNKDELLKMSEEYTSKGNRVLALTVGKEIKDKKVSGNFEAISLIILEDHIRENAPQTFDWFKENSVGIKVISGDNAMAVSEIARSAHVDGAEQYVSLAGKTLEETYELASKYNVFGRVNPDQKEVLVKAFKDQGRTVAMTGDGVNDILALKRADCSIALASGADAARNVSHIVLMDSNFDHLPEIVSEGRRVINNLQRTSSVFLVKTIFAMVITFVFTLLSIIFNNKTMSYPFQTNNMYPWEIISIGFASFFLALQPNDEIIKGGFLKNIFQKAVPSAIMMILSVFFVFTFHFVEINGGAYFSLGDFEIAASLSCLVFNILSLFVLYRVCSPFDKYRKKVFAFISFLVVGLLAYGAIMTYCGLFDFSIIKIRFDNLTGISYLIGLAAIILFGIGYLAINEIIKSVRKIKEYDKSK